MSNFMQSTRAKMIHWTRRGALYVVLLLVAFLLGFVPMWWKSRERSRDL